MQFMLVAALTLVSLAAPNMPAPMFSVGSTGVVATSADASADATANGPSVVEVPLEQTLEVRPAPGWSFASCDALLAATPLVTACTPESFTVTGPSFDPAIEPVRVRMLLANSSRELTVDYVIRLAQPEPPAAPDTKLDLPLAAGAVSLIPLAGLGIECGLCSAGTAKIEVRKSAPDSAGVASVTGTHLVFAAAPNARGPVEIDIRVTDDIENHSKTIRVTLHLVPGSSSPLQGLHLVRSASDPALTAAELVLGAEPDELVLAGCSTPLHGTVTCAPDGTILYTPPAGTEGMASTPDQFSVRIVSTDGRQALASVTVADTGAALAAGAGSKKATLQLSLPEPPPQQEEEAQTGVTTGFSEIMNAMGAQ